jgi:hypothetical protein
MRSFPHRTSSRPTVPRSGKVASSRRSIELIRIFETFSDLKYSLITCGSPLMLTARPGEILEVLDRDDESGWIWCRSTDGREGWVPSRSVASTTRHRNR